MIVKLYFFKLYTKNNNLDIGTCCEIVLNWMPQNLTNELVWVMTLCHRVISITWASVDPALCRHMASLGQNELSNTLGFIFRVIVCSIAIPKQVDISWQQLLNTASWLLQVSNTFTYSLLVKYSKLLPLVGGNDVEYWLNELFWVG